MAMSSAEKSRIAEFADVERLSSDGLQAIERGEDANAMADELLELAAATSDALVAEAAHGGISSGQLKAATRPLASVNDLIATATNAFSLASRVAKEREAKFVMPFIAGKAAGMLELLKALGSAADQVEDAGDLAELGSAISDVVDALAAVRAQAEGAA